MIDFLRSDAVLRQFVNSLTEYGVVILDEAGNVVSLNNGACGLKGYEPHEVVGAHFSLFYAPEARAVSHPERELAVAASVGRYEEDGWRLRKDGSRFWAHVVIVAIYDEDHTLRGFGKIVRDDTERKQAAEQSANVMKLLELTARTDYLTGLDNRRSFDRELSAAVSTARRKGRPLSLAMLDFDLFKSFNDRHGHQAGDAHLRRATAAWRRSLRAEDFIARYGGEEFVVILPETDAVVAAEVMERLRAVSPAPLTCSIGLAEWDGSESADRLIGRADGALFAAKAQGRDRVIVASGCEMERRACEPAVSLVASRANPSVAA